MRLARVLLRRWRESVEKNKSEAATVCGISQAMYWELESGQVKLPGIESAFVIEAATGGAVPAWSWTIEIDDEKDASRALAREAKLRKAA